MGRWVGGFGGFSGAQSCRSVFDHEAELVGEPVDGAEVGAVVVSRTDVISPSEIESFPTSRVGPLEVIEKPLTTPVTGRPDASLPETVSPMRFAAADV
jgi:hypothetical protein